MATPRRPQPLAIRITHWVNIPVLVVMAMSGLQIFCAYPHFGPRGAIHARLPVDGWIPPSWARAGGWLAGARHLHFALAWLLVVNAIVYLVYLGVSREWRRRFFWPPRDIRPAIHQLLFYLRLRKEPPPVNLYNGLQRSAYTAALAFGILVVWSGLVMYKPVQLSWLGVLLGGYDGARLVHFACLIGLAGFALTHIVMVLLHPRSLGEMITGGKRHD